MKNLLIALIVATICAAGGTNEKPPRLSVTDEGRHKIK